MNLKDVNTFLKSKPWVWGTFGLVVALGIAYFIYAWTGHAPTEGPDNTNPWPTDGTGFKNNPR